MSRFRVIPVVVVIGFLLLARVSGQGIMSPAPHHCTPTELENKTCESPGYCINACAVRCSSKQTCYQCCAQFSGTPSAQAECQRQCDMIPWPT